MTNSFRYHHAIAFILISLFSYTPCLHAWDRGHLGGSDQNAISQTDIDADKKDIVRKERPTNTPVSSRYQVEIAKPHQQPGIERQPIPPTTTKRPEQQERHFQAADTTPFQPRENSRKTIPSLSERTPLTDKNIPQPQPFVTDRNMKGHRLDKPNTHGNNPFEPNKNYNTLIKPAFEPHDRNIRDSRETRPREHIRDDIGIDRTPIHRPILVEKIYPARGLSFYRELPVSHTRVFIRNQSYFIHEGRFYKRTYNGFIWIVPPIGFVVTTLPFGCTSFIWNDVEYYTYAGIYYRPSYGGYVVVEEPDNLPSPWEIDPPPVDFVKVNTELLNVRSGPSVNFPVIEQAMYGERLQVLGSYEDWYYVRLGNGRKGWVLAYYTYPENQAEPMG